MGNEKDVRTIIDSRFSFLKDKNDRNVMTYKCAFEMLDHEKINKLRVIIKSDVDGISEAINNSLKKICNEAS
jgi:Translation initiation factor 2 (IF-2; GTPase)